MDIKNILDINNGFLNYQGMQNPTSQGQMQQYLINQNDILKLLTALFLWQSEKDLGEGAIVCSPNMPGGMCAMVKTAGRTGTIEPAWSGNLGDEVTDGSVTYTMGILGNTEKEDERKRKIIDATYPVGIILEFAIETDPNEIWDWMTWEKMDAGRVLVSDGEYSENGFTHTYTVGEKGGEAMHQLTTEELPQHSHNASTSSIGGHAHGASGYRDDGGGSGNLYFRFNRGNNSQSLNTNVAGASAITTAISSVGNDNPHENRMPYETIFRWKRTA